MDAKLRKAFYRTAYILMIIFTVFSAFCFLVPLCWMIPMTLRTKKAYLQAGTADESRHTALGIWGLFFGGFLPGLITLLAANAYKTEEMGLGGNTRSMFYRTAYQLMIIKTVFSAFAFLVPLAWHISMTLRARKAYKQVGSTEEKRHTALAVWSFFFIGVLPALFLLFGANEYKAEVLGFDNASALNKTKNKINGISNVKRWVPLITSAVFALVVTITMLVGFNFIEDVQIDAGGWASFDVSAGIADSYAEGAYLATGIVAIVLAWIGVIFALVIPFAHKNRSIFLGISIPYLVIESLAVIMFIVSMVIGVADPDGSGDYIAAAYDNWGWGWVGDSGWDGKIEVLSFDVDLGTWMPAFIIPLLVGGASLGLSGWAMSKDFKRA